MSERAWRRGLWLVLLAAAPLPLLGPETGLVPVGRMALLGALCLAVVVSEGARGVTPVLAALFLGQALAWSALLLAAAWAGARALARARGPARAVAALAFAAALAALLSLPVYRTPHAARSLRATLLEVYR
jgi:hypothetical protein